MEYYNIILYRKPKSIDIAVFRQNSKNKSPVNRKFSNYINKILPDTQDDKMKTCIKYNEILCT